MKAKGNNIIMVDQVDRGSLLTRLKYGGPVCEFQEHPEGVVVAGQLLEPVEREAKLIRPSSLH